MVGYPDDTVEPDCATVFDASW